jgi:hypothetical protein
MTGYKGDIEIDYCTVNVMGQEIETRSFHLTAEVKGRKTDLAWRRVGQKLALADAGWAVGIVPDLHIVRWADATEILTGKPLARCEWLKAQGKVIKSWLGASDLLILKANGKPPIVVLPSATLEKLS